MGHMRGPRDPEGGNILAGWAARVTWLPRSRTLSPFSQIVYQVPTSASVYEAPTACKADTEMGFSSWPPSGLQDGKQSADAPALAKQRCVQGGGGGPSSPGHGGQPGQSSLPWCPPRGRGRGGEQEALGCHRAGIPGDSRALGTSSWPKGCHFLEDPLSFHIHHSPELDVPSLHPAPPCSVDSLLTASSLLLSPPTCWLPEVRTGLRQASIEGLPLGQHSSSHSPSKGTLNKHLLLPFAFVTMGPDRACLSLSRENRTVLRLPPSAPTPPFHQTPHWGAEPWKSPL